MLAHFSQKPTFGRFCQKVEFGNGAALVSDEVRFGFHGFRAFKNDSRRFWSEFGPGVGSLAFSGN
jgi:hypothetical protein